MGLVVVVLKRWCWKWCGGVVVELVLYHCVFVQLLLRVCTLDGFISTCTLHVYENVYVHIVHDACTHTAHPGAHLASERTHTDTQITVWVLAKHTLPTICLIAWYDMVSCCGG